VALDLEQLRQADAASGSGSDALILCILSR
jgi:hypothetical protein